jgi:hypothetical protein
MGQERTWETRAVTALKAGDKLRIRPTAFGTHVGRTIRAGVEER